MTKLKRGGITNQTKTLNTSNETNSTDGNFKVNFALTWSPLANISTHMLYNPENVAFVVVAQKDNEDQKLFKIFGNMVRHDLWIFMPLLALTNIIFFFAFVKIVVAFFNIRFIKGLEKLTAEIQDPS